ncbi:MAG: hypothetical protein FWF57_08800 [Defluviitaleaceae bacterium]|nr:hypothetical protein [Defluviitaleaceae bacterium]
MIKGIIFSIILIFISIFVFGGNRLISLRSEYINNFKHIAGEISIYSRATDIWGQGHNLIVLINRATNNTNITENLSNALNVLDTKLKNIDNNTNFAILYEKLTDVINEINILNRTRDTLNIESVHSGMDGIIANVNSSYNIIRNSSFNNMSNAFNETRNMFPANIISIFRGVRNIEYFGE